VPPAVVGVAVAAVGAAVVAAAAPLTAAAAVRFPADCALCHISNGLLTTQQSRIKHTDCALCHISNGLLTTQQSRPLLTWGPPINDID
jgi:mono/diheme cytochrome c family protein